MKIYFVLFYPGYWRGFVTTNEELAMAKLAENPEYRLESTEIKPVDFVPSDATLCVGLGSCKADVEHLKLGRYYCFFPVFNKNKEHTNWYQCVHEEDLPKLETGIEVRDPECDFFGTVLHIRKHTPSPQ